MEWPLLASLDDEERRQLLATTRRRTFARGEVLVHEGDPSDSLHLVAAGRLAVRVSTADGDTVTLNVLGRGDYFGELSLLDGHQPVRSATVVALEPAETLSLSAAAFDELRRRHRGADQLLLTLMARRVEDLSARLLEALYDGLDRRVFRRLAELAAIYGGDAGDGPATIPLTQEHLADLVGGTRPSVNQVLQRLAGEGVVELGRGRITVLDRGWLTRKSH
ncbi:CRP-like cAMP-binding protein [Nocardioides ginsengisegetis]|uniref:CRP-like cAMP-binding protein n=1 Tax=Nocardioides ginsengisegetis TaxID=661491 RepID=A0A7W3IXZ4_9ACTN|nr:Crp/Fnr family transcriptional regulator [Nocardioides ginsengisegetis]MBA8802731.1 CRP-like cAMP-binding protein [Nocardioides ginsengisegetis]